MYRDTDYLYATMRLRAAENKFLQPERAEKLLAASDYNEALKLYLGSLSPELYGTSLIENGDSERLLEEELKASFALVTECSPDKAIGETFLYSYDCQNIKSAIKCELLGYAFSDYALPYGAINPEEVEKAVRSRDFSAFPEKLRHAAASLFSENLKDSDPQRIDIVLDKACIEAITDKSAESPFPFLSELARIKADLYNISSAVRCAMMKKSPEFFKTLLAGGGFLDAAFYSEQYEPGTVERLCSALSLTRYSALASALSEKGASVLGKLTDEFYYSMAEESRMVAFGGEVLIGFLIRKEKELKNVRIILAGKKSRLDEKAIRERMRS